MIEICGHQGCTTPAVSRVFWPGRKPIMFCEPHVNWACSVSRAMGFDLHIETLIPPKIKPREPAGTMAWEVAEMLWLDFDAPNRERKSPEEVAMHHHVNREDFVSRVSGRVADAIRDAVASESQRWSDALHAEAAVFDGEAAEIADGLGDETEENTEAWQAAGAARGRAISMRELAIKIHAQRGGSRQKPPG